MSSAAAALAIPALLTASRSGPSSASAPRTAAWSSSLFVTSAAAVRAQRPVPATSCPARSRSDPARSTRQTSAPNSARPMATRRPMPLAAPVTRATRSSRRNSVSPMRGSLNRMTRRACPRPQRRATEDHRFDRPEPVHGRDRQRQELHLVPVTRAGGLRTHRGRTGGRRGLGTPGRSSPAGARAWLRRARAPRPRRRRGRRP